MTSEHPRDAPADRVMAVIADFASYPEWAASVKSAEVVQKRPDGRAGQVRFVLDAGMVKDKYVLAYDWAPDGRRVGWSLVESTVMKSQEGFYDLAESAGTTRVTYTLEVQTSMPMLGLLRRKGEKMIMNTALTELKKRVELIG